MRLCRVKSTQWHLSFLFLLNDMAWILLTFDLKWLSRAWTQILVCRNCLTHGKRTPRSRDPRLDATRPTCLVFFVSVFIFLLNFQKILTVPIRFDKYFCCSRLTILSASLNYLLSFSKGQNLMYCPYSTLSIELYQTFCGSSKNCLDIDNSFRVFFQNILYRNPLIYKRLLGPLYRNNSNPSTLQHIKRTRITHSCTAT